MPLGAIGAEDILEQRGEDRDNRLAEGTKDWTWNAHDAFPSSDGLASDIRCRAQARLLATHRRGEPLRIGADSLSRRGLLVLSRDPTARLPPATLSRDQRFARGKKT
jgi:hypothetical protein